MTKRVVDQQALDLVRRLLLFDRWIASRALPAPLGTDANTVNPVEALLVTLLRNTALPIPKLDLFELSDADPPEALIGAGDDKDLLRDGDNLGITLESGDDGFSVELPGLLRMVMQQSTYTQDIPSWTQQVAWMTMRVGASDIRLRPADGEGNLTLRWHPEAPQLTLTADFETEGPEITGALELDWNTVRVSVDCRPRVVMERLLWDFQLRIALTPAALTGPQGMAQHNVVTGIQNAVEPILAEWGTLAMSVLMALPLRPMRDELGFFSKLATSDVLTLGSWLEDQMYGVFGNDKWLTEVVESCLLPNQPFRTVSVKASAALDPASAEPEFDFFHARLADHYVRHVGDPAAVKDDVTGAGIEFDVEPIPAGTQTRELSHLLYGVWRRPPNDTPLATPDGAHCVVREQYLIQIDRVRLGRRSFSQAAGGPWTIRGEIQVRHRNLGDGQWATVQHFAYVSESSNYLLTATAPSHYFEWLEVRGEVRVKGLVEDRAGTALAWFDQSRPIAPLPSLTGGLTDGGGGITLTDHQLTLPPPLPPERRADALIRLAQRTSLRTYQLDWLGLRMIELELTGAGSKLLLDALNSASVPEPALLRVEVNGRRLGDLPIDGHKVGALLAGESVRFPAGAATYDLYFYEGQDQIDLRLDLAYLREDGHIEEIKSLSATVPRHDPAKPGWEWRIPPGLAGSHVTLSDDDGFKARLYLQDRQFDAALVPMDQRPKPYEIGVLEINVTEPTEWWIFNLRELNFTARFWVELQGERVGTERTRVFGPYKQATPVSLVYSDAEKVFDHDALHRRVEVPPGGVVKVSVTGKEARAGLIPVAETDLGTAESTYTFDLSVDPEEGDDAEAVTSDATEYFHFVTVARTASRPPVPEFVPQGSIPSSFDAELTLGQGTAFTYDYATVPWTRKLQLERRSGFGDDDATSWQEAALLTVDADGSGSHTPDPAHGSEQRFRLRARNSRGSRYSRVLFLTLT